MGGGAGAQRATSPGLTDVGEEEFELTIRGEPNMIKLVRVATLHN